MEVTESNKDGAKILHLSGEIDLHASPELRKRLQEEKAAEQPILLLDFSDVSYIDSSGLATLIEYCRECSDYGGKLALFSLAPKVKMVFELVRLNELFTICDDEPAAFAALDQT